MRFFFTSLGGFFVIAFEGTFTKWEIDNPHVNSNLSGWEKVNISTDISFRIPDNWSVECENGVYSVLDSEGNIWALGTLFGTDTDYFYDYSDFLATTLCKKPFELSIEICPEYVNINAASIDKITIDYSDSSESYYIIDLLTPNQSFLWVLLSDISQNADAYDIAVAIMYSFNYQ